MDHAEGVVLSVGNDEVAVSIVADAVRGVELRGSALAVDEALAAGASLTAPPSHGSRHEQRRVAHAGNGRHAAH